MCLDDWVRDADLSVCQNPLQQCVDAWHLPVHHSCSSFINQHQICTSGLILHGGNGGNCLRCPWSLPWCPFRSPNRNLQIPHRGALCQGKITLPLQVRSIRPGTWPAAYILILFMNCLSPTFVLCQCCTKNIHQSDESAKMLFWESHVWSLTNFGSVFSVFITIPICLHLDRLVFFIE